MADETQHVFHHDDQTPEISVKAEKNTKGWNYEAKVTARSPEVALAMLQDLTDKLKAQYGQPE